MFNPIKLLTIGCCLAGCLLLASCRHPQVPQQAIAIDKLPVIAPDYTDVTIPSNLCPINFMVREAGEEMVCRITAPGCSYTYGEGKKVIIDADEWQEMKRAAQGGSLTLEIFVRQQGDWYALKPFEVHVAHETIDPYISYRLIPPSYVSYEEICIEQRDLTTFDTQEIYNNRKMQNAQKTHCINCHSYQNYHTGNMLFHLRKDWGGTVLVHNGKVRKINLKTPETLSAGVYPAWHPTLPLIAFSTNLTAQNFHATDSAKIEVFDGASDLILYDIEHNSVSHISNLPDRMESFPTWSPDGQYLYFTMARTPFDPATDNPKTVAMEHYAEFRYDLCRKSFDAATQTFGPTEMVYEASADSMSVSLPRLSPDGRWLAFAMAPFGSFHVWHPNADIYLMEISADNNNNNNNNNNNAAESSHNAAKSSGQVTLAEGINSGYSESYPSFSSNGRWLMTASRRDDGNYTRPYIAYFDAEGRCHKPFEVPQKSPDFYTLSLKSFNRPEFMVEPVGVTPDEWVKAIEREAQNVQFKP